MRIKLQFVRIGVNLLGSFLTDFRNSRGKFDEIMEEFAINPAPIPSESSLNAGGTRWTRDLPRNSLNFFTSWSKVEEQRREIHAFKEGKLGPTIMAIGAVMESVCKGCGSSSSGRRRSFGIGHEWASISAMISAFLGHASRWDRPRSWPDRASIGRRSRCRSSRQHLRQSWSWFRLERSMIATRSRRDRGAIEPRSWSSSTLRLHRPMDLRLMDDLDFPIKPWPQWIKAVRWISRLRWVHVASILVHLRDEILVVRLRCGASLPRHVSPIRRFT